MPNPGFLVRTYRRLDGSLRARLFVPTAVLSTTALMITVLTAGQLHGADLAAANRERAALFASLATEAVLARMAQFEHGDISAMLGELKGHRADVDSLAVITADGRVSATTRLSLRGTVPWTAQQLASHDPLPVPGGEGFVVLRRMTNEARCHACHEESLASVGFLEMRFSHAALHQAQRRLTASLIVSAIPALLLLLGVAWWLLGREAVRPIQRLVGAMQRAEQGGEGPLADEGRTDEIGTAARMFDSTMAALRASQAEVRKAWEQRIERADRFAMIGQMATGLAHEIKNPLAGLSGALELLAEDLAAHPQQSEVVAEMRHQVDRLATIMDGLLSFARPPKARPQPFDLNLALEKAFFLVGQQRRKTGVVITRDLAVGLPPVYADPGQMEQVFLNIGLNACEALHAHGGGRITVRSLVVGGEVVVHIADDGPGIPPEVRPNIFTPFFTTRANGTGLGLALSMRLITEHGGRLELRLPSRGRHRLHRHPAGPRGAERQRVDL